MKTVIGVIGCGYVFDHYMATLSKHPALQIAGITDIDPVALNRASLFYGLNTFPDNASMFADPSISIIVNLTSIVAHHAVTRAALVAGKHVYSEKPLVTAMAEAEQLFKLASDNELHLSCAPCNALSSTTQTMWQAVVSGSIGDVRLVYAEFDDNPVYLMEPEGWRSRSGAPWPYLHEYEMGCTWEHVGYHLAWMCAIFGPVRSVTAFSKHILPDKTAEPMQPDDTPDFSVACLDFASGVVGRITCSIAAPFDHRMRVIGNQGMVHADTYRHYRCPVYLERFTKLSLNARKSRTVRTTTWLQALLGVTGKRLPLAQIPSPMSGDIVDSLGPLKWLDPRDWIKRLKRSELGQQDKCIGIAELAAAINAGRAPFPGPDFILHATELTLAIQAAGRDGSSRVLTTSFSPLSPPEYVAKSVYDYDRGAKPGLMARLIETAIDGAHRN